MSIKEKVFLNNLLMHLGIDDLSKIKDTHSKKILAYIKIHKNEEFISSLVTNIPNFLNFATAAVKSMSSIYTELIRESKAEVGYLKEIIVSLSDILKMDSITENDKKEIYALINRFSDMLEKQLEENKALRKKIYGGVFSIAAFSTLLTGYVVIKAVGGETGAELLNKAGKKLMENTV